MPSLPAAQRSERPPRDNLIRAIYAVDATRGLEMRATDDGGMPTMLGHFAVFNRWTEIDSFWEGRFMERIAPGAFKKTFRENRAGMRVLFQHGMDFSIGDKPIARIDVLREDETGAYYESPLIDARYVRDDILPGLEADVYGASFRFQVMKEGWEAEPEPSDDNPAALPERTIREARVAEYGPVTFPAYPDATAGVRSLTDLYVRSRLGLELPDRPAQYALGSYRSDEPDPEDEDTGAGAEPHSEASPTPEPGTPPTPEPVAPVVPVRRLPKPRHRSFVDFMADSKGIASR